MIVYIKELIYINYNHSLSVILFDNDITVLQSLQSLKSLIIKGDFFAKIIV
jgi:hypothetical protein